MLIFHAGRNPATRSSSAALMYQSSNSDLRYDIRMKDLYYPAFPLKYCPVCSHSSLQHKKSNQGLTRYRPVYDLNAHPEFDRKCTALPTQPLRWRNGSTEVEISLHMIITSTSTPWPNLLINPERNYWGKRRKKPFLKPPSTSPWSL